MIYQGSKARLRKYLLPVLQGCIDKYNVKQYFEPFVGGANVIDHIRCDLRIGNDYNSELITLLKYMQKHPKLDMFPEHCPFEHYADVRESRKNKTGKYSEAYTAGIGYFASYGGRYFDGGYGRDARGGREIYSERLRAAKEQAPDLAGIDFTSQPFTSYFSIGFSKWVIYMDPPYRGTKVYDGKNGFDYEAFYDWARKLSKDNYVFISEYWMPEDFIPVWSKERNVLQKSNRTVADKAVEKLFVLKGGLYEV